MYYSLFESIQYHHYKCNNLSLSQDHGQVLFEHIYAYHAAYMAKTLHQDELGSSKLHKIT